MTKPVGHLYHRGCTPFAKFYGQLEVGHPRGCWHWIGNLNRDGYGRIAFGHGYKLAHRWSYEFFVRPLVGKEQLDHLCRVRHCVNPGHLEPVTAVENIRRSKAAKLDIESVRTIRSLAAQGITHDVLSRRFKVCSATISHVVTRKHWADVD